MIRRAVFVSLIVAAAALGGCGRGEEGEAKSRAVETAWRAPPYVRLARLERGRLILTGTAQPGARVVMRDGTGAAHAATASAEGAFEIELPAPTQALLLRPEDQDGQRSAAAPELVLVLPHGAAAALSPGVAARRLDAGSGLAAVDSDGRMAIITGRAPQGRGEARVRVGGGAEMTAPVDAQGVWSLRADVGSGELAISVDGVESRARIGGVAPGAVVSDPAGTTVGWSAPDGAALTTWIPAR